MDVLNFGSSERIDFSDFKFAVADSPVGFHSATVGNLLTAQSGQRTSVLSGFVASSPSANVVSVSLGRAIGAYRKGAVVQYGVVCAQGDAQKTLDVSALSAGTYGVFVRFTYVEGSLQNRVFWAPSGNGYEYAQAQNTRLLANWDVAVELAIPGPEWIQVATAVLPAMTFTDTRPLYFEGRVDQGYASSWGSGVNDRSSNRALYGIGDWQTFAGAMRTCLEDIKGPGLRKWYDPVIGGQNIGFAGAPTASRTAWGDANYYAQGSTTAPGLTFDTGDSVAFDRANNRWSFALGGAATALLGTGLSLGTYAQAPTAAPAGGLLASGAVGIGTATVGTNALAVSGNTALTGTLSVSGASTLSALGATTGTFTSNVAVGGTLGVSGTTTLGVLGAGATTVTTLSASGAATLAAVSATTGGFSSNVTVGGTLGVTGATTVAGLSAGATQVTTLSATGAATLAALSATTGTFAGNVAPNAANTYNLGSSANPWSFGYMAGLVTGSRILATRGWVGTPSLTTNGTYVAQNYMPGATPGFVSAYFVPDTAGSIAGMSVKVYNTAATAGSLTLSTNGATTNPSSSLTYTQVNNAFSVRYNPGQYPFAAGAQIVIQATTTGWAQTASGASGVEMTLYVYQ